MKMIQILITKGKQFELTNPSSRTRKHTLQSKEKVSVQVRKRRRVCLSSFEDQWPHRTQKGHHRVAIVGSIKGTCIWCSKIKLEMRQRARSSANVTAIRCQSVDADKIDWSKRTGRTNYVCKECTEQSTFGTSCFICKKHMDDMHPNGHAAHP